MFVGLEKKSCKVYVQSEIALIGDQMGEYRQLDEEILQIVNSKSRTECILLSEICGEALRKKPKKNRDDNLFLACKRPVYNYTENNDFILENLVYD